MKKELIQERTKFAYFLMFLPLELLLQPVLRALNVVFVASEEDKIGIFPRLNEIENVRHERLLQIHASLQQIE